MRKRRRQSGSGGAAPATEEAQKKDRVPPELLDQLGEAEETYLAKLVVSEAATERAKEARKQTDLARQAVLDLVQRITHRGKPATGPLIDYANRQAGKGAKPARHSEAATRVEWEKERAHFYATPICQLGRRIPVKRLMDGDIQTFKELRDWRIAKEDWWKAIPGIGRETAQRIETLLDGHEKAWLTEHPEPPKPTGQAVA